MHTLYSQNVSCDICCQLEVTRTSKNRGCVTDLHHQPTGILLGRELNYSWWVWAYLHPISAAEIVPFIENLI